MFVNSTKTTLSSFCISISYNDENSFEIITKIIQLFRYMKLNIVFEPIEIAGQNYLKNIKYGIDEENLLRLKKNSILLHTPFDYSSFKENEHILAEKYLDIALQNYFIKSFSIEKNKIIKQNILKTDFFAKKIKYISNLGDYNYIINSNESNDKQSLLNSYKDLLKVDFYYSFGSKYSIFALNNFDDQAILFFIIEMLKYLGFNEQAFFLKSISDKNFNEVLEYLKHNDQAKAISTVKTDNIKILPKITWKNIPTNLPDEITKTETKLDGKFLIKDLVVRIKNKQIKLNGEEYELCQILDNEIEYYPNINFWDEIIINPVIKLQKKKINKKIW